MYVGQLGRGFKKCIKEGQDTFLVNYGKLAPNFSVIKGLFLGKRDYAR